MENLFEKNIYLFALDSHGYPVFTGTLKEFYNTNDDLFTNCWISQSMTLTKYDAQIYFECLFKKYAIEYELRIDSPYYEEDLERIKRLEISMKELEEKSRLGYGFRPYGVVQTRYEVFVTEMEEGEDDELPLVDSFYSRERAEYFVQHYYDEV